MIDCTVRSISETGTPMEVVTPLFNPDRFKLIVQSDSINRSVMLSGAGKGGVRLITLF
jgi:hypothetical protein